METSAVNLREYTKIYTGTNQETGYETPLFGFTADTSELIFKTDATTYFHYPLTALSGLLIDSSLVKDGAIAGENPYCSDKVWKKQVNYSSSSIWGNSHPIGKQTGVWLCSWLSGNPIDTTSTPVWKDRWYNPGYVDATTALFVTNPVTSSIIVDIDSEMVFEGGCYYKYFHVGNIHNDTIVTNLTGGNHLKLYLEDWSQTPTDLSEQGNKSTIQYYTGECVNYQGVNYVQRPTDSCLNLHKTNYCETLYSSAIALTGNLSYNIWAKSDDWTMGNNTILSKNNRGGYSLKVDTGFNTPYLMFFDVSGKMMIMNHEGHTINSKTLPQPSTPTSMVIDTNNYVWVSDNSAKKVYKIDYNGDIVNSLDFDPLVELNSIALDDNKLLWVLDSSNNNLSSFDIFTNKVDTTTNMGIDIFSNITIDLNSNIQATSGTQILVDNNNTVWTVEGNTVYNGTSAIIGGTSIACDKDNNIWILSGSNAFLKMDATTYEYTMGTIGLTTATTDRGIDFVYELVDNVWNTVVYFTFADEQKLYKADSNGTFIKTIDTSIFDTYSTLASFTAYDWHRKFNYMKYDQTPQMKADLFIKNGTDIQKHTLSTPVNGLNDGNWHMFTYTTDKNNLKFYMDSVLRDSYTIGADAQIFYTYENAIMLGTDSGKTEPFANELGLLPNYFVGKVDALRIYDSVLNNFDIRYLYLSKYDFNDLLWNIPTGTQSYIEEVIRFFKFKLPGQKSQYYNINLIGLQIEDANLRIIMEKIIKDTIKKVAPAYAELYKIVWK